MIALSIVIPVYNVKKYLSRCIESLVVQDISNCEIILVDDGSNDGSEQICDEFEKAYGCIHTVHKKNGGLASARNCGLRMAQGRYVVFIDSDDWVDSDYIDTILQHIQTSNVEIIKFGFQRVINGILSDVVYPFFDEGIYKRKAIEKEILPSALGPDKLFDYSRDAVMSSCAAVYSIDFLRCHNISFKSEREILHEDFLFNYEVLLNANSIEILHWTPYKYDFRDGSLSKRYIQGILEKTLRYLDKCLALLRESGCYTKLQQVYYNQCVDNFYACITNECSKWNSTGNANRAVKEILQNELCREALKKCNSKHLSIKGRIIYIFMKYKQAWLMVHLYKTVKGK